MHVPDRLPMPQPAPTFATGFAAALLAPDMPPPACVAGPSGKRAVRRYDIYRNNVTVSLIEALASIFPAVRRITGDDFFRAMARFHLRETPPASPLLFEYGRDFPAFIDGYAHAGTMPWLGDVARLERAWLDAYHAADAPILRLDEMAGLPPHRLGRLRLRPHPAARAMSSDHPVVTIFAMNRVQGPVGRVENVAEEGLLTRVDDEVVLLRLQRGGAAFAQDLLAGRPLEEAAATAFAINPAFDLSAGMVATIGGGAFSGIEMEDFT